MPAVTDTLAPAGITSVDDDFIATTDSVLSGIAVVVDSLDVAEVVPGTLGLGNTKADGSAVFDFFGADILAPIDADSLISDLVALCLSPGGNGLDTDPVGSGMIGRLGVIPLVVVALTSEVTFSEFPEVILSGSELRLLLIVVAADSLNESSLDGAPVMLDPTGRLEGVTTDACPDVGVGVFSPDGVLVSLA